MTYPEFVQELTRRFGEQQGIAMAIRAEVGFLRKYLEQRDGELFTKEQELMIDDFLNRHPEQ